MSFDYRPIIGPPDQEESQQGDLEQTGRVGANHNNNCGPSIFAQVFKWLGNGDPHEPQEIAGAGYVGGMTTDHVYGFFKAHRSDYPRWADISVQQGGDVVALANQAAGSKYPMVCWFWSDAAAVVKPYRTGILHWCAIVADDGARLVLRNPEWDTDVALPYAQARAAYAGEFTIFQRGLIPPIKEHPMVTLPKNWNPWQTLDGKVGAVASCSRGHDRLDVFGIGADGAVWMKAWDGQHWSAWGSLGGSVTLIAATSWGSSRIDLVGIGTDQGVWHRAFDSGTWGPWEALGGEVYSLAATSFAPGRIDIVGEGSDGACWHLSYTDSVVAAAAAVDPRDAQIAELTGKLAAANAAVGTLQGKLDDRDAKDILRRAKAQELVALL